MTPSAPMLVVIVVTSVISLSSWSQGEEAPISNGKDVMNLAAQANTDFTFDLYRQLAGGPTGNLFFSPYSVSVALAMATEGARGETALEMGRVLRFPEQTRNVTGDSERKPWQTSIMNASYASLNSRFHGSDKAIAKQKRLQLDIASLQKKLDAANATAAKSQNYRDFNKARKIANQINALIAQTDRCEVKISNAIWGERSYPFHPAFTNALNQFFGTGAVFPCDFVNAASTETARINAWVARQTADRIKNLLADNSLNADTRLVLTNAVYFKGEWDKPFRGRRTKERPFWLSDGNKINAATMYQWNDVPYAAFHGDGSFFDTPLEVPEDNDKTGQVKTYPDEHGFQVLELPYHGDELSMVILVPRSTTGLAKLESLLTSQTFSKWMRDLQKRETRIYLPKFKMETGFELSRPLQKLGMRRAFADPTQPDGADFSGMSTSADSKLQISSVVHKAFVDVSEKGTEAAAATAVLVAEASAAPPEKLIPFYPEFKAERPFVFLIRDRVANTVLFCGRVNDPRT